MYTYTQSGKTIPIPASAVLKALRLTSLDDVVFPVHIDAKTQNIAEITHKPTKLTIIIDRV